MNRGFTEREAKVLSRSLKRHGKRELPDWIVLTALILEIFFVAAYLSDNVLHLTSVAHAAYQPVNTLQIYCQDVKAGEEVRGATAKELKKLCP